MKKILLASTLSIMAVTLSQADVLANWDLDSLAGTETSAAVSSTDAGITAGNLFREVGSTAASYPDSLSIIHNAPSVNSLATSIVAGDFFSFTLTPDEGTASYDNIFARVTLQANAQPATTEFNLLSSVTGFTSLDSLDAFSLSATVGGANNGTGTFDVSGVTELQTIAGAVEFRIYYHNTGLNSMTRLGIGQAFATNATPDLTVNGTTAIPEPSTYAALAGLAALGFVMLRRRSA